MSDEKGVPAIKILPKKAKKPKQLSPRTRFPSRSSRGSVSSKGTNNE